ncbi:hypothetical protein [Intestinirhabdus alba]|jgi:glycosyl transferase family 25|uniref:Uncharacterized protein n=1 Tax=Intestinirhabdus alba TaxID=2899544 RepID=A0A6L6IJ51_9ENTR|nr:hypothetical protein [Intestinirhabdus alba]MTH46155.1 hypothetical protein [Intestinirhabdus alba]
MTDIDWRIFDKVICIQRPERRGDRSRSEETLQRLGVPAQNIYRLDAVHHLLAHIGEAQTHLAALETAIAQGWGTVLILDEGMVFNSEPGATERLGHFIEVLKSISWGGALLSAQYRSVAQLSAADAIVRPLDARRPCAYAVHADYLAMLHQCFKNAVDNLRKGGDGDEYAIDMAWLPLMQQHTWLGLYPVAGHPAAGEPHDFYPDLAEIAL